MIALKVNHNIPDFEAFSSLIPKQAWWLWGSVYNSQFPHTETVVGSICSTYKLKDGCHALVWSNQTQTSLRMVVMHWSGQPVSNV